MKFPRSLRGKLPLGKLGFSALLLVMVVVIAETAARAIEPGPFEFFEHDPYVVHPAHPALLRHKPHFRGRWDGTWYAINSLGARGREFEPPGSKYQYRVVCLGDATTFGKGVRDLYSWPRQLERLLTKEALGAWRPVVANLGVNGYSGEGYRLIFEEVGVSLEPDLVVVAYAIDDFAKAVRPLAQIDRSSGPAVGVLEARRRDGRIALARLMSRAFRGLGGPESTPSPESVEEGSTAIDPKRWALEKTHLEALRDAARGDQAKMVVLLFPTEDLVYPSSYETFPIDRLRDICHGLEVPFVDLTQEFRIWAHQTAPPRKFFLRGDDEHPNAAGYGIVARSLLRFLREQDWMPPVPKPENHPIPPTPDSPLVH